MKVHFDPETDAMYVTFSELEVVRTDEVRPGILFDMDASGRIVAIEVLHASRALAVNDIASLSQLVA
jgi:uncharacterized protein YuzE